MIDLASSPAHPVNSGDNIRIEVMASGCSLGGHPGYVYVDEITDNEIAGPTIKATGPATAGSGSPITYTYNYRNGSAGAINPTIVADQPTGVTFTSVSDATNCNLSGGTVTCNFTGVPMGGTGSFTVTGTVTSSTGMQVANGSGTLSSANYSFALVNGTLLVTKAPTATAITNVAPIAGDKTSVGQTYSVNWMSVPELPAAGTLTGNVVVSDGG